MNVCYTMRFLKTIKRLQPAIQEDVQKCIERIEHPQDRDPLHVYALSGRLRGLSAFTVNFAYHVIAIANDDTLILLDTVEREQQ
jgi:mRNA-degrading endonuclease RelE of RelBE toxin-antitoxin system